METVREIKITVEIDTNKRTRKGVFHSLSEAVAYYNDILETEYCLIEESYGSEKEREGSEQR